MKPVSEEDTMDLVAPITPNASPPAPFSSLVELDVSAQTHTGKVRESNEDNFLVARGGRTLQVLLSSIRNEMPGRSDETGYAMVVADGMGGVKGGEIASSTALVSLLNLVLNTPDWILQATDPMSVEIMGRMYQRFVDVNTVVAERAKETASLTGMGTTLTAAWSL